MPLKIKIATFVHDGANETSQITMEIDRIVFHDDRIRFLRQDEVLADLPVSAVTEIELVQKRRPEQVREQHPRAYEPWAQDEEQELIELYTSGVAPAKIAKKLKRQTSAIRSRLKRLGYDEPPQSPDEAMD